MTGEDMRLMCRDCRWYDREHVTWSGLHSCERWLITVPELFYCAEAKPRGDEDGDSSVATYSRSRLRAVWQRLKREVEDGLDVYEGDAALDQIPQGVVDERRAGVLDCLSELEREITRGVMR